jgi:alkylation response protein AidB-like acyl-CoA dehydrogenase
MAKSFTVRATTDPNAAYARRVSTFIVKRGMDGLSNGKVHDKIGSRNLINAEGILDNVKVPIENRLGEEGFNPVEDFLASSHPETGAILLGIARRAYEEILAYTKQRVAGGKRMIEHQAVALLHRRVKGVAVDMRDR